MYLVCDLGASSADWGLYNPKTGGLTTPHQSFELQAEGFADMLENQVFDWINKTIDTKITMVCIAVAGMIEGERVRLTNGERWGVRANEIAEIVSARGHASDVHLLNDFEALSLGLAATLARPDSAESFVSIYNNYRFSSMSKRIAVCGPGTGLGASLLLLDHFEDGRPFVLSSEAGHKSFAPESESQIRFFKYFESFHKKVSYEDILSKEGLLNLYNYFRKVDHKLDQLFHIPAYQIVDLADSNSDVAASDALQLFCEILANFCGNLALTFNVDRGIFLWGGVTKSIPEQLLKSRFRQQFAERAMHSDKVREIPVGLLTDALIPLRGCAYHCAVQEGIEFR